MHDSAEALVDRIIPVVRSRLPAGVTPAYFDVFVLRNRTALVASLDRQLAARATTPPTGPRSTRDRYASVYAQPPDLWAVTGRRSPGAPCLTACRTRHHAVSRPSSDSESG